MTTELKELPRCGDCRFFDPEKPLNRYPLPGMCRRFPKLVKKQAQDWCGEHALTPPAPNEEKAAG